MTEGLGFGKRRLIENIVKTNWLVDDPNKKNFNYNELLYVVQEMNDQEGKAYLEGGENYVRKGHNVFKLFVEYLLRRNLANYDSMLLLTALKGGGKSSASISIAREWCRLIGIKFDPERHIAYNNADMMNKISKLNSFEPIIADESIRFASSEDWNKASNKELKKKLAQVRTKHLLYILCFPLKIKKLEKTYLESFCNYWCLNGDTRIIIKDRYGTIRSMPMNVLSGESGYKVLSYNKTNKKFEFKKSGKCVKTNNNSEVFKVEIGRA